MKILIVDDNEQNLYMLEALLKGHGHKVVSAGDGVEALEKLKSEGADMIISDILMPRMDGFKLCHAVRSDTALKGVPFIIYTATYTDTKDIQLGLSLGADRFLIKPQETDVFLQVINEVLAEYAVTDESAAEHQLGEEMEFLRQYNESLFRKLEKKISDLKRANQALLESEERFRNMFEQFPVAYQSLDEQGRFIYANEQLCRLLGYGIEELMGKSFGNFWSPETKAMFPEKFAAFKQNVNLQAELQLSRKNGDVLEVYVEGRVQSDADGRFIRSHCILVDITLHKRAEAEKALLEEQLRQAQKMEAVGQLAGGVAHDFNNMLTAIIGYASMALDEMAEDDPNRHNIDQILVSSNKAAALTQSLLAFSRKQVVTLRRINLNETLAQFEKFLLRLLREDIKLTSRHTSYELPVMADRGQIEQVLMNLVANARDSMPKGGRIIIETNLIELDQAFVNTHGFGEAGEYALLSVTDTGEGITEDIRHKIFEPFFTTKTEGNGTGLGLSMVYGIVKQHKGSIDVYSEPGMGTTFKIYLPLDRSSAEAAAQQDEEQAPPRGGNETILVAEDDAVLRHLAVNVLRHYGYTVIEAVDGLDAVAKALENRGKIDLVLLDGIMPNMNGKEAWQEIKALNPRIKAVFISGYAGDVFSKDGIPGGDTRLIQKPASPTALVRKIRAVLDE